MMDRQLSVPDRVQVLVCLFIQATIMEDLGEEP